MNKYLSTVDCALWISGLLLEFLIIAASIHHKHYRRYPAFFIYICTCAVKTLTLMYLIATHSTYGTYYVVYWALVIVKVGMLVAVAIEIFGVIFKPLSTIPDGVLRRLFLIVTLATVLLVAAACFFPAGYKHPLEMFFNTLDRTATFVVLSAVMLVLLESEVLGIPKNLKVYGISLGILFTLSVDSAINAVSWIVATSHAASFHRLISMSAFSIAGMIWLYYFSKPEPKVIQPTREELEMLLKLVTSWGRASNISKIS